MYTCAVYTALLIYVPHIWSLYEAVIYADHADAFGNKM